ncbi:MAG: LemA family protein [bacterium]|nr:LemA family protein [bacterium]
MPHYIPLVLIGVLVLWSIFIYNRIVVLFQRVRNAWSQIDVQLKRRYDLIPNLVEIVKGYMAYEKQTLERVIRARTQAIQASTMKEKIEAENLLTGGLRSLLALVENYPELKANQNMLRLQEELTTTENRISFARQYYNDEVMQYNSFIQSFPVSLMARLARYQGEPFFEMEDPAQRRNTEVRL